MIKRFIALAVVLSVMAIPLAGCEWAGRVTGKTVKGVEKGAKAVGKGVEKGAKKFEKGYRKGSK